MTCTIHTNNNNNKFTHTLGGRQILGVPTEGYVETAAGRIHVDDWVTVTALMKRLIIDMSKDENLASKYPYIEDAANKWLIDELRK